MRDMNARTLIDKLWDAHRVKPVTPDSDLLYIDRVFLHERTGSLALRGLEEAGRKVRNPRSVFVTMDHIVDTRAGRGDTSRMPGGEAFILATRESAKAAGVTLFDVTDRGQGIVHVVSPEQGIALPGVTLVCPDSHTCTIGGLGALAWGIGSTEAEHALATQTLAVHKPKQMRICLGGALRQGVYAKDLILHLIGRYGASAGVGYAVEFAGSTIRSLSIESRLTLCNMAVELGAWTGVVAPDETTIDYVSGRPYSPRGAQWDEAVAAWQELTTDDGARFDAELSVLASGVGPQVTWGTSPQHVISIDEPVPAPDFDRDRQLADAAERALAYMAVEPGRPLARLAIDGAFIGSCTNGRLSDLREAAAVLRGRRVASNVQAVCVPGSTEVKRQAESEGIDGAFRDAGFDWQESGCAMCFYAGGPTFGAGARVMSSTNRNFEGRQGPGVRTHLASPATVAASAVLGRIAHAGELA